jgi:hypothetical protein
MEAAWSGRLRVERRNPDENLHNDAQAAGTDPSSMRVDQAQSEEVVPSVVTGTVTYCDDPATVYAGSMRWEPFLRCATAMNSGMRSIRPISLSSGRPFQAR